MTPTAAVSQHERAENNKQRQLYGGVRTAAVSYDVYQRAQLILLKIKYFEVLLIRTNGTSYLVFSNTTFTFVQTFRFLWSDTYQYTAIT